MSALLSNNKTNLWPFRHLVRHGNEVLGRFEPRFQLNLVFLS